MLMFRSKGQVPAEDPDRRKRGGAARPFDPPKLRSPGEPHVEYPTILVARDSEGLDGLLVNYLERSGFHVLKADSGQLFDIVRVHSRPIHLLLTDVSMESRVPILKKHRSEMHVLFVQKPVDVKGVLAAVRQLLGSPPPSIR